jgi:hypothetical protein
LIISGLALPGPLALEKLLEFEGVTQFPWWESCFCLGRWWALPWGDINVRLTLPGNLKISESLFLFWVFFFETKSLYIVQPGLELARSSCHYWDYWQVPPHLAFSYSYLGVFWPWRGRITSFRWMLLKWLTCLCTELSRNLTQSLR